MRRWFGIILVLIVGYTAWSGISAAHTHYGSLWLDSYLALFVALPLALSVFRASFGAFTWEVVVQSTFSIMLSLLVTALVYRNYTHDWLYAALAGVVVFTVARSIRVWPISRADSKLNGAIQTVNNNGDLRQALA